MSGSEAKWEWGDDDEVFGDYGWYEKNSDRTIKGIKLKKPNKWGIYDMYGNVYEYCRPIDLIDPKIPLNYLLKDQWAASQLIGGCYKSNIYDCNVDNYKIISYDNEYMEPVGFRLIIRKSNNFPGENWGNLSSFNLESK